jgi:hypothetical protein
MAEQNDLKRDNNRNKRTRALITTMARTAGINVDIEGAPDTAPKPGNGFTVVDGDGAIQLLHREGASKAGVTIECIIEVIEDSDHYQFWVMHRQAWYRVREIEVTKRYKGNDTLASEGLCKLISEGNHEKRLVRTEIKRDTYGTDDKQTWVLYKSNIVEAPVAVLFDNNE